MSSPKQVDCLISARWILPVRPSGKVFEFCTLVVNQGRIVDITPQQHLAQRYQSEQHFQLDNQLLMPGLVNAHGHAAMSLLRGFADDLPLMTWLQDHIWPAEAQWVDGQFVADGTELAIAEMLLSGTTCFSDMYFYPNCAAEVSKQSGIRAQITFPVLDFPTSWAKDAEAYIHQGLEVHQQYRSDSRIQIGFGPHAPYTVSDQPLVQIATLAEQLQANIQIHAHETAFEVSQSMDQFGVRPLQRLADLGILGPRTQCVHMTQVNDADIDILQATGASVIHCPESNMKLASGLCPVDQFLQAGITVGLGTDGAASNNDLNMLGEMQTAALLGKITARNASAVNAQQAIEMATIGGARALGIDHVTGSLEMGKAADVIALKLDNPSLQPLYDLPSNLVYNNRGMSISHVWVDGHQLVHNSHLLTLDAEKIQHNSNLWRDKIASPSHPVSI